MCSEIMAWMHAHISHQGNCGEGPAALWGSGSGKKRGATEEGRWGDRRERLVVRSGAPGWSGTGQWAP